MWIPVQHSWRLNERHYGALQGLNKAETAAKFGDEQVLVWRRSYDVPPPALEPDDPRYPGTRPALRGARARARCPLTECLKDTVARVAAVLERAPSRRRCARASACSSPRTATRCARWSSTSTTCRDAGHRRPEHPDRRCRWSTSWTTALKPLRHYYLGDPAEVEQAHAGGRRTRARRRLDGHGRAARASRAASSLCARACAALRAPRQPPARRTGGAARPHRAAAKTSSAAPKEPRVARRATRCANPNARSPKRTAACSISAAQQRARARRARRASARADARARRRRSTRSRRVLGASCCALRRTRRADPIPAAAARPARTRTRSRANCTTTATSRAPAPTSSRALRADLDRARRSSTSEARGKSAELAQHRGASSAPSAQQLLSAAGASARRVLARVSRRRSARSAARSRACSATKRGCRGWSRRLGASVAAAAGRRRPAQRAACPNPAPAAGAFARLKGKLQIAGARGTHQPLRRSTSRTAASWKGLFIPPPPARRCVRSPPAAWCSRTGCAASATC